jgi:integrase
MWGGAIKINEVEKGETIFPYSIFSIDKKWRRICGMAGLEDTVRVHDLRHTFGSRAGRAAQDDPYAVQELMGHTDFRTTQKYIHVSETRKRVIMEKLGSVTHISTHIKEAKSR